MSREFGGKIIEISRLVKVRKSNLQFHLNQPQQLENQPIIEDYFDLGIELDDSPTKDSILHEYQKVKTLITLLQYQRKYSKRFLYFRPRNRFMAWFILNKTIIS